MVIKNTSDSSHSVAFLGLGPMGEPIARHIAAGGYPLQIWNRTRSKADALHEGAIVVDSPADFQADVVLSALPDVDQFEELAPDSVIEQWAGRGTRFLIILSTTSREKILALSERVAPRGIRVIDAPMSGGDSGARAGTLSLMVGAAPDEFTALLPLFETFASTVRNMGPTGTGAVAKLCNQVIVAGTLVSVAESLSLARRAGLSLEKLIDILRGGLASSAVLDLKAAKLLERDYTLGGSAGNQLKDLTYALNLAQQLGATLPVTRETTSLFEAAVSQGLGDKDHAVVQELLK